MATIIAGMEQIGGHRDGSGRIREQRKRGFVVKVGRLYSLEDESDSLAICVQSLFLAPVDVQVHRLIAARAGTTEMLPLQSINLGHPH